MFYFGLAKMYIGVEFFCFLACIMIIQCWFVETIFEGKSMASIQLNVLEQKWSKKWNNFWQKHKKLYSNYIWISFWNHGAFHGVYIKLNTNFEKLWHNISKEQTLLNLTCQYGVGFKSYLHLKKSTRNQLVQWKIKSWIHKSEKASYFYHLNKKIECIIILWWVLILLFINLTSTLPRTLNCTLYHAFTFERF
jgi:hypothetical protein